MLYCLVIELCLYLSFYHCSIHCIQSLWLCIDSCMSLSASALFYLVSYIHLCHWMWCPIVSLAVCSLSLSDVLFMSICFKFTVCLDVVRALAVSLSCVLSLALSVSPTPPFPCFFSYLCYSNTLYNALFLSLCMCLLLCLLLSIIVSPPSIFIYIPTSRVQHLLSLLKLMYRKGYRGKGRKKVEGREKVWYDMERWW